MTLERNLAFLSAALRGTDAKPGDDLLDFAREHALAEILDGLLEGSPLRTRVPAETLAAFREARLAQARRSAQLLAALDRVTGAFRAAGIGSIAMKGPGLGARFYGGVDRRATRDLDLLVAEEDLPAAERVLRTLGFRRASIVPLRRLAVRWTHAFDYVRDGITVDLHWTLARHPSFRFDPGGLRGRREERAIGEVRVDQLGDEDALAFGALAVFRDVQRGALRARALVDLHRIAAACPGLDGEAFLARRRAEGTYRITVNVLALLLHALGGRDAMPAVAAAVDAAADDLRVDATTHRRLLSPSRFALRNRLFAIRLYECSPARSFLWWLVSLPVRVLVYRSWRLPRRGRAAAALSRPRRVVANLVLAAILAGSSAAIVTGRELWPFSPYPMFSALRRGPTVSDVWLYGVLPGGDEIPLSDRSALHPFRLAQIKVALERLDSLARQEALEDMLVRYERRRRAGRHAGPELAGLRCYRMTFELDDRAANRDRPLARELLAEARAEAR